jgi:hypothetical protein
MYCVVSYSVSVEFNLIHESAVADEAIASDFDVCAPVSSNGTSQTEGLRRYH